MLGLGPPSCVGAAHSTRTRLFFGSCKSAGSLEEGHLAGWRRPSRRRSCRSCRAPGITSLLVGADGKPTLGSSPVRVYDLSKPSSNRVVAEALVHAPAEQVWEVLTDYERLAEFIPNLDSCKRVPCPKPGRVWVVQRACSQSLLWRLEAEAVLEVVEEAQAGVLGRREVRFSLVEGDFKELHGRWVVEPAGMACLLRYDITVVPKLPLPATIVNHVVRTGLPANILALAQRAEQIAAERLKPASIAAWAGLEDDAPLPGQQQLPSQELVLDQQQLLEQPVPGFQLEEQELSAAAAGAAAAADCPPGLEAVGPACVFSAQSVQDAPAQDQGLGTSQPRVGSDSSSSKGSSGSSSDVEGEEQQQQPQTAAASAASASVVRWWEQSDDALPSSGPFWSRMSKFAASAPLTAAIQRRRLGKLGPPPTDARSTYLGLSSVPLPGPLPLVGSLRAGPPREPDLQARFNESQRQKELLQAQTSYPAFGLQRPGRTAAAARERARGGASSSAVAGSSVAPGVETPAPGAPAGSSTVLIPASAELEVHLRRLDGFDYLHRRAVAAITIDAPPEQVWRVLTDYDSLAEFVPNLAVSQRIALPPGAPPNVVRVRQVGYKRVLYMAMHAESVLDLVEKPISEVQFRQVAGDFERFQGKWMLQEVLPLGSEDWGDSVGVQTQLKYAMELLIPRATRLLGIMEPVLERCVFEDMPANLAAIKRRVEALQAERERAGKLAEAEELEQAGQLDKAAALRKRAEVPRPREMYEDFGVLAAELERCFGADKVLPSRTELREMNRYDLEKAIAAHGGPAAVAQALGWSSWGGRKRNRKPRGYWDSADNLRAAIDEFIAEHDMEPDVMPVKNQLVRAGRYDIARAVEKWGGVAEVAERLGYALGLGGKEQWYSHVKQVAREKGLSGSEGLFEEAAKTYGRGATATSSRDSSSSGSLSSLSSIDFDDGWSVMREAGSDPDGGVEPNGCSQRVSKTQDSSRLAEPGVQQQATTIGKAGVGSGTGPLPGRQPRSRRKQMASGMGNLRQEIDSW